jgi:hypothetical protein
MAQFDSFSRELCKMVEPQTKHEDEGKFHCCVGNKSFKAESFMKKHVSNKHSELFKPLEEVSTLYSVP